jgi:hypothetical protein
MPKNQENKEPQKLTTGRVKKIAAGIALTGTLLGGMNLLNNAENPERKIPRTESLAESEFVVTGPEKQTEVGKDVFFKGQKVSYLNELAKFDFNEDGHYRNKPVPDNGDNGGPSNDLRIEGLQNDDLAYISRPIITTETGNDPNGMWVASIADGGPAFINDYAARETGALETVLYYPGVNGDTNIQSGTVLKVYPNGLLVQKYDENGRPDGDPVSAGVTLIGPEMKP